jgi:myo-inositol-1(or 4)-monophosphatase
MDLSQERKIAIEAASEAGKYLLERFRESTLPSVKSKGEHDILTQADLKAEEIILDRVQKHFPSHQILSEEAGLSKSVKSEESKESESLWLVDPLDGTTNFSMKNPLFGVSIGLRREGRMILGIVYSPVMGEMFVAEEGKGAHIYRGNVDITPPLQVSSKMEIKDSLLMFCHGAEEEDFRKISDIYPSFKLRSRHFRQLGSASLELAYVACGRAEAYMTYGGYPWDLSAGILLVEEAQGKVSTLDGGNWDLESKTLLATNGKVHEEILEIVNGVENN